MSMSLRPAAQDDIRFVWDCRQELDQGISRTSANPESYSGHSDWMTRAISDTERLFLIAADGAQRLGYMRADPARGLESPAWMVSLCLAQAQRGRGLARPVLAAGCEAASQAGLLPLLADIHATNLPSRKVFEACGFVRLTSETTYLVGLRDGFDRFIRVTGKGPSHEQ